MATSEVAIANRALQKLGAGRIEDLAQDHPNARTMSTAFAPLRDALLRRYDWAFAIKRAQIAEDLAGPVWGDWNRYTKPSDFLRLLRNNESGFAVDWKIEGDFILSADASPLEIRYIAQITDPNKFDPLFIEALASYLASETCEEITQSSGKKDRALRDFDMAIAEAMRIGAIEKDSEDQPEDEWISARR